MTGRAEFIDDFLKMMKRELDIGLPLKATKADMLGKTRAIITGKIDHIQFGIAGKGEK
jgi:hypothetical protein